MNTPSPEAKQAAERIDREWQTGALDIPSMTKIIQQAIATATMKSATEITQRILDVCLPIRDHDKQTGYDPLTPRERILQIIKSRLAEAQAVVKPEAKQAAEEWWNKTTGGFDTGWHKEAYAQGYDAATAMLREREWPLVKEIELAAQQLEDLTPVYLNWHLLTGEIARRLRAALTKTTVSIPADHEIGKNKAREDGE